MSFYSRIKLHKTIRLTELLAKDETRHYIICNHLYVLPKSGNPQTQQKSYEPANEPTYSTTNLKKKVSSDSSKDQHENFTGWKIVHLIEN